MTPQLKVSKPRLEGEVRLEPSARRVRVKFGGEFIADTRNALLVWDNHYIPAYFFPPADVRREFLEPSGRGQGERTTYRLKVNDRTAENAAWSYTNPSLEHAVLKDYVAFRFNKMDAWYEEEEEIFVHPRDPHKRVDAILSSRHVRVEIDGVTVADTKRPVLLFETGLPTRYYIPPEDVRLELLEPTATQSHCPYKGVAAYWSANINGQTYQDITWSYPEPIPECPKIEGLLAFFDEKVDVYVDGELEERPQTPWS